ncbi:hypothetical protein BJ912DRAFT_1048877 [Pholiota molesta]|nr:hypothetical protein BJ912DRAFT_1048877 [Pholiota molesta]
MRLITVSDDKVDQPQVEIILAGVAYWAARRVALPRAFGYGLVLRKEVVREDDPAAADGQDIDASDDPSQNMELLPLTVQEGDKQEVDKKTLDALWELGITGEVGPGVLGHETDGHSSTMADSHEESMKLHMNGRFAMQ